ncbi:MAG: MipA/OmpV family protein [Alphaproteobacteria bacterium]|nr:MipA/OmpV family protein [Alphaproteobacteria bacterium SS10]
MSNRPLFLAAAISATVALSPALALANDDESTRGDALFGFVTEDASGFVGAGVGIAPEYEGSEDYDVIPLVVGQANWRGFGLELRGLGAAIDVLPSRRFDAGPVINFRGGRDDDVDNDVVARLREIDDAIEVGGFFRYNLSPDLLDGDRLSFEVDILQDVSDAHEGLVGGFGAAYSWRPTAKLGVILDVSTSFASSDYMDTYFTVDTGNSALSGLPVFEADSGFKDIGIGTTLTYDFNDSWGALARIGYTELLGDAADSPIVDDEGSSSQFLAAVGITYRF